MSLLNRVGGNNPGADERTGFKSLKTLGLGIRYGRRWSANALIQATLDPRVRRIFPCSEVDWAGSQLAFGIDLGATNAVVVVHEDDQVPPPNGNSIYLSRSQIMREPIASSARSVWAERDRTVPAADRVAILLYLTGATEPVTLQDLIGRFQPAPAELVAYVLRLACDCEVNIDLGRGLSPETPVWRNTDQEAAVNSGQHVAFEL